MSKIFVVADDNDATRVQIMTIDDPEAPDDEAVDPFYAAQCRTQGCVWNSFVDDSTIHVTEADAINDAEVHLDEHEHADT